MFSSVFLGESWDDRAVRDFPGDSCMVIATLVRLFPYIYVCTQFSLSKRITQSFPVLTDFEY